MEVELKYEEHQYMIEKRVVLFTESDRNQPEVTQKDKKKHVKQQCKHCGRQQ